MKRKSFLRGGIALAAAAALVIGIAAVTGSPGKTAPVGDHWVDNLRSGTTASDFNGNTASECSTAEFLAGNYDLWHFIVTQPEGDFAGITWNSSQSVWSDPSVVVTDVTDIYGPSNPTERLSHLWLKTEPPGVTLIAGYLNYQGSVAKENLSHSCGHDEPAPGIKIDPDVSYDMTWDWTVDKSVDWAVNPAGGYTLTYSIESDRSTAPRIIPGSLHITDSIVVTPPTLVLTGLTVSFTQGTYVQPCDVDLAALHTDCELDVTKITTDPTTGRPTGGGTLAAVGTYSGGTLTDSTAVDLGTVDPSTVYAETASLTDDYATPGDTSDDPATTQDTLGYVVNWTPTGTTCNERTNIAILLIDNPVPGTENPTDTVTVRWCPPMPGLTIGYWGNKTGSPILAARYPALKAQYPNVFGLVGPLGTATAVRNFLQSASCSGDCKTMFVAQFLATAMNALDPAFASQGVSVNGECMTVSALLAQAETGAHTATKIWYETYKSIFDSINNSRQVTCLTVID